jgi:hypothetical protein
MAGTAERKLRKVRREAAERKIAKEDGTACATVMRASAAVWQHHRAAGLY